MILNWNGWDDTFACLRSIRQLDEATHVWLIDNGSDEDRTEEARVVFPGLRLLRWDNNYGWGGGYNRALSLAALEGREFVYLLNNDSAVTPGFLISAVAAAQADERLAVVGSRIGYAEDGESLVFDGSYHAPGAKMAEADDRLTLVTHVHGAAMLVRLGAIEEAGYFDERLFCYGEEIEWCERVARRGWRVAVAGSSLVFHRGYRSDLNANAAYYRARNQLLVMDSEHRGRPAPRTMSVYANLRAANEARRLGDTERANAIAAGVWDGLLHRDGKRRNPPPAPISFVLTHFWIFPAGFFRTKLSSIRRLAGRPVRSRAGR
jgi:GT2 family glycosyltransferase